MEASQASEAGSIPVARSTPARPRAGRFCYGCAGCARTTGIGAAISARGKAGAQRLHVVQTPHHCRHGGRTPPTRPGAMSVGARKFAQQGACSGSSAKKLAQQGPHNGTSAKKLAQRGQKHRIWGVLSTQGEVFRAFALKQRRRANFFAPGTATTRNLNVQGRYDALTFPT